MERNGKDRALTIEGKGRRGGAGEISGDRTQGSVCKPGEKRFHRDDNHGQDEELVRTPPMTLEQWFHDIKRKEV